MRWHNEPPQWHQSAEGLTIVTGQETDFWRSTYYGFVHDNGHFFYDIVAGDFTAEVEVQGDYQRLYDQAGLMVRLNERCWVKAGIEYTDGQQHLSAVVTRDFSDWSVLPLIDAPDRVWIRFTKKGEALAIQHSPDGQHYKLLRLAYLPEAASTNVGMMCCSPQGAGFKAAFRHFRLGPPEFALHG